MIHKLEVTDGFWIFKDPSCDLKIFSILKREHGRYVVRIEPVAKTTQITPETLIEVAQLVNELNSK